MWNAFIKSLAHRSNFCWTKPSKPLAQIVGLPVPPVLASGEVLTCHLSEAQFLSAMVAAQAQAYGEISWEERDFTRDMIENPNALYLQLAHEGNLVGFIGLRQEGRSGHISNFLLLPAFQGCGLGHYLLLEAMHYGYQLGWQRLTLEVRESNTYAQQFYLRHGFTQAYRKENYYSDGEAALLMIYDWKGVKEGE